MPNGRYIFSRTSNSIEGFFSTNTASTDALNALLTWSNIRVERRYEVITDEDELLTTNLSWDATDLTAGQDLDDACRKFGVDRSYERS